MSGHSKFANIKHKKEKNDAAKGKNFHHSRKRNCGPCRKRGWSHDPANNFKLAQVVAKAKSNNMPNDAIERGIQEGSQAMSATLITNISPTKAMAPAESQSLSMP